MFAKLGRFSVNHPWSIIAGWIIATVALVMFAPTIADITKTEQSDFLPRKYESIKAQDLGASAFTTGGGDTSASIVVKRADGGKLTTTDQQKVEALAQDLTDAKIPSVLGTAAGPQTLSPNERIQLVNIDFRGSPEDQKIVDAVGKIRDIAGTRLAGTGLQEGVTGDVALSVDNEDPFNSAFAIVGVATIVLIIGLILIIFRSPIAALLPIVTIGSSSCCRRPARLIAAVGKVFDLNVDSGLQTVLLIVLYGIGTDYILFLLFRYRERLRAGDDQGTAMVISVDAGRRGHRLGRRRGHRRVPRAAAGLAGLLRIARPGARDRGRRHAGHRAHADPGGRLAARPVGLLAVEGVAAHAARPPLPRRLGDRHRPPAGARRGWHPAACWSRSRSGVFDLQGRLRLQRRLPAGHRVGEGRRGPAARASPAGALAPTEVYLTTDNGSPLTEQHVERLRGGSRRAPREWAGLQRPRSAAPTRESVDGTRGSTCCSTKTRSPTRRSRSSGDDLRDAAARGGAAGHPALVGGTTAIFADINAANNRDLSVILPVAAGLIALILALLLRSLVAPIYLVIAVLLGLRRHARRARSIVFQGLQDKPGVTFQLPIILYLFVVAIGTDYNILMIARLREEAREGNEPREAAAIGVEHAGPTVAARGPDPRRHVRRADARADLVPAADGLRGRARHRAVGVRHVDVPRARTDRPDRAPGLVAGPRRRAGPARGRSTRTGWSRGPTPASGAVVTAPW